jgi:hypothetical protein
MFKRWGLALCRVLGVMIIFLAAGAGAAADQDLLHVESKTTWFKGPSPLTAMNRRIHLEAQKHQEIIRQGAKIPRAAFFDMALPADPQEFAALDGNAVLVVTALSHDQAELPLKRVYVKADGQTIELKRITHMLSQEAAKSLAAKTFGQYRMDGMYLLPVYLRAQPGELTADFARNRDGFVLSRFGGDEGTKLGGLPLTPPSGQGPSADILKKFIAREFPGFKLP